MEEQLTEFRNSTHEDDPHFIDRSNWLRAAVLGANDGIVSVAALIVGVAAAGPGQGTILLSGLAGLVAGAMSMAAGEYVSVSSQSDIERADIKREQEALELNPEGELEELISIFKSRGLSIETAGRVAEELTAHDALDAHLREELGMTDTGSGANPFQAAWTSALTFAVAASVPLITAVLAPAHLVIVFVLVATLLALGVLGALSARTGGAPIGPAVLRVTGWGTFAMAATMGVGWLFGISV